LIHFFTVQMNEMGSQTSQRKWEREKKAKRKKKKNEKMRAMRRNDPPNYADFLTFASGSLYKPEP
jgi:hypothetical protein